MTLTTEERAQAARLPRHAERNTAPVEPLSVLYTGLDLADAYAVQQENVARRMADGGAVVGHEVGTILEPGHLVLPGAMTTAPFVAVGQKIEARFSTLGSVSVTFADRGEPSWPPHRTGSTYTSTSFRPSTAICSPRPASARQAGEHCPNGARRPHWS
jgi:2-keto-4-pentenoate hydratase